MTTKHRLRTGLVAGVLAFAGCSADSGKTTPSTPQTGGTTTPSVAAGLTPATHDQVEKFRTKWNATDASVLSLVAPKTPAYAYTETAILINKDRKQQLPRLAWSGSTLTSSAIPPLSAFAVDADGRIADLRRDDQPIADVVQPGNGTTYKTPDGKVEMHVAAFRGFDIDGGNLSTVFTVTNHGKQSAILAIPKLYAAGNEIPLAGTFFEIPGGGTSTEPLSEGAAHLPPDVTLTVTLSDKTSSKSLTIPVPQFG